VTARILDYTRSRESIPTLDARADRIYHNIAGKIPSGAQLASLGSASGDSFVCDGCDTAIEDDEVAYVLEFRHRTATVTLRLHPDCWESSPTVRPNAPRVQSTHPRQAVTTRRRRP
jgi:hypothetical protein